MYFFAVMCISLRSTCIKFRWGSSKFVCNSQSKVWCYNCRYAYPCLAKCVTLVKHALLMADILIVSLFETRELWKLRPTQALPFACALANSAHEMDGSPLFITHCNCPFMFNSKTGIWIIYLKKCLVTTNFDIHDNFVGPT